MSATHRTAADEISAESLSASGRIGENLSLPALQSKMMCYPEGYETKLALLHVQFNFSFELFHQKEGLNLTSVGADPAVAKELGDRAMFLTHVAPFYPQQLFADFPPKLDDFLGSASRTPVSCGAGFDSSDQSQGPFTINMLLLQCMEAVLNFFAFQLEGLG
ncbi:Dihydroorotate dehydrogenase(DHOD) like [Actinidia chinensis var. chinensis]|uniref:Protein SDA1 n=1 Tax=Actinidia chinensis var. chinensis TaxID=1590841 RepID=A0A2R6QPW4_ACTCC|nr:Dihydroorotate dehydrogenase(DHOD) like [Actinidia chinensis var. chinensis]